MLQLDDVELRSRLQHLPIMDIDQVCGLPSLTLVCAHHIVLFLEQIIAEAFNIYEETKQ